jgi:hypothetical protein
VWISSDLDKPYMSDGDRIAAAQDKEILHLLAKENRESIERGFGRVMIQAHHSDRDEGIIGGTPLSLLNTKGNRRDAHLIYRIAVEGVMPIERNRMPVRAFWEIYEGNQSGLGRNEEIDTIAFRAFWPRLIPDEARVNNEPVFPHISGMIETDSKWSRLGLASALLCKSLEPIVVGDFVERTKGLLASYGVTNFGIARLFLTDTTLFYDNASDVEGWTSRMANRLGFEESKHNDDVTVITPQYTKDILLPLSLKGGDEAEDEVGQDSGGEQE